MPQLPDSVVIGFALEVDGVEKIARFSNPAMRHAVLFAPEMLAMLREIEWVDMGGISRRCPCCDSPEIEGHDTCRLSTLLKKARGEDA